MIWAWKEFEVLTVNLDESWEKKVVASLFWMWFMMTGRNQGG